MSRLIEIFISDEMEKTIGEAKELVALLEQMKRDADNSVVDLDYAGIPEYQELEQKLAEIRKELGDTAMKSVSLFF